MRAASDAHLDILKLWVLAFGSSTANIAVCLRRRVWRRSSPHFEGELEPRRILIIDPLGGG